ncbi:MAG: hypothetical protein OXM61_10960 [Candidatus Poribacteria bacterium]|nr:hypothetical protein [Candidatus Poribacteria bacterium]
MSQGLRYKRNWAYEQMAEVTFVDGHTEQCFCQTDNKGRIAVIQYEGADYVPDQLDILGIQRVQFMTPAVLEIKVSTELLIHAYLELGRTIAEGDTMRKVAIRGNIEKEIRKRGLNLHDEMERYDVTD